MEIALYMINTHLSTKFCYIPIVILQNKNNVQSAETRSIYFFPEIFEKTF